MLRLALVFGLAACGWIAAATGVGAQDMTEAQTPTHNIQCMATQDAPGSASLRCDLQQMNNRPPPAPRGCPLSYGDSFALDATGTTTLLCHGDTVVVEPNELVIAYGTQWRPYGFVCTSATTGLTCTNSQGHGFSISREAQRVF